MTVKVVLKGERARRVALAEGLGMEPKRERASSSSPEKKSSSRVPTRVRWRKGRRRWRRLFGEGRSWWPLLLLW